MKQGNTATIFHHLPGSTPIGNALYGDAKITLLVIKETIEIFVLNARIGEYGMNVVFSILFDGPAKSLKRGEAARDVDDVFVFHGYSMESYEVRGIYEGKGIFAILYVALHSQKTWNFSGNATRWSYAYAAPLFCLAANE
jgi:hypothetical protein